CLQSKNSYSF
nr:immunoglobulin light chain junction region [Macaca mulatta]MOX86378.1 immunoglobulin light chain junction region [Macaca mulatta]MOX88099.1 immunoglobulin light chain junction region [Macaca mulatta]